MATSANDPRPISEGEPPYPTYEFLKESQQWVSLAHNTTNNLVWNLDGPLETAISVKAETPSEPQAHIPLYDAATGEWHPIARRSVSLPRVRSIVVHVYLLSDWERTWDDLHYEHSDEDDPYPTCDAAWGPLEGHSDELQLLRCCGTERPVGKDVSIVVRPGKAADKDDGGEFVTVQDYVSTVHPWLMSLRGEILAAIATKEEREDPLPENYPLVVGGFALDRLMIYEKGHW